MNQKAQYADEYTPEATLLARQACLALAVRLGDLLDEMVVVGGLVPSLLIARDEFAEPHVGTADLDIGLSLALLGSDRYAEIADRLRGEGFAPDQNNEGRPVFQRWHHGMGITVDFLIPPTRDVAEGGRLQHLTGDLAAMVTPGLQLAFQDRVEVLLNERLPRGERASRTISVCGPGAFVVLKALAFRKRGEPKDAYDLHYMVTHAPGGLKDIARRIDKFRPNEDVSLALQFLEEDFTDLDLTGPHRVATFLLRQPDETIQADVAGSVRELLRLLA